MTVPRPTLVRMAAAGLTAAGVLLAAPGIASAAVENIANGTFQAPGTDDVAPTGWTATNFGAETQPYNASLTIDDVNGSYPPPTGTPGGDTAGNFAGQVFYEGGNDTGIEGYGGSQTLASPVPSTASPKVSFATVEPVDDGAAPDPSVANWAGQIVQLDLTSGSSVYHLVYIAPSTPSPGSATTPYSSTPASADTQSTYYQILPTLTPGQWATEASRDVDTDALAGLGLTSFTVTSVEYGNLEDTTSALYPYPNMTTYFKDISLQTGGGAPTALPESPLVLGLPLLGLAAGGGVLALRARRR